jgi:hypothetical protein
MLEVGRKARRFGTQALLQPFPNGVADRSGRLAIDLFAVVGDSAIHGEYRFVSIANVMLHQVIGIEIVSGLRQNE